MKFKIAWQVLCQRCAATWQNLQRVQWLAKLVLGRELPVEGVDEKPIHFNEAGSKNQGTLCLHGFDAQLKQNHANTRNRATVMTSTTSDKASGDHEEGSERQDAETLATARRHVSVRDMVTQRLLPTRRRPSIYCAVV